MTYVTRWRFRGRRQIISHVGYYIWQVNDLIILFLGHQVSIDRRGFNFVCIRLAVVCLDGILTACDAEKKPWSKFQLVLRE